MTLSRRENDTPRPARSSVRSASPWRDFPGGRIVALLRQVRGTSWSAVLESHRAGLVLACGLRRRWRIAVGPKDALPDLLSDRRRPAGGPDAPDVLARGAEGPGERRLLAQASRRPHRLPQEPAAAGAARAGEASGQRYHPAAGGDRDPDRPRRPGRRGDGARRLALHDQAVVHLQYHRHRYRRGNRTARAAIRPPRRPRRWSPSRTATIPSRSARSGPTPCRAAAWGSSSTARRRTPT